MTLNLILAIIGLTLVLISIKTKSSFLRGIGMGMSICTILQSLLTIFLMK